MSKSNVFQKISDRWTDLQASWEGLSDEQLLEPGACGKWSVKDIWSHIAFWEGEAIKYLPLVMAGGRLPRYKDLYGGIDAFNEQTMSATGSLNLTDARANAAVSHEALLHYLEGIPEEYFRSDQRFYRRLMLDTANHYPEHSRMIRAWRDTKGY